MKKLFFFLIGTFFWTLKGFSDTLRYVERNIIHYEGRDWEIERRLYDSFESKSFRSIPTEERVTMHEDSTYGWQVYIDELQKAIWNSFSKETIRKLIENSAGVYLSTNVDHEGNILDIRFLSLEGEIWKSIPDKDIVRFASNTLKTVHFNGAYFHANMPPEKKRKFATAKRFKFPSILYQQYDEFSYAIRSVEKEKRWKRDREKYISKFYDDILLSGNGYRQKVQIDRYLGLEKNQDKYRQEYKESYQRLTHKAFSRNFLKKFSRIIKQSKVDPILQTPECNDTMLASLDVEHVERNWFMVSFQKNKNKEDKQKIMVKVNKRNSSDFFYIDYIVPPWHKQNPELLYGDSLFYEQPPKVEVNTSSPKAFLQSFYRAYTNGYCSLQVDLNTYLSKLKTIFLTKNALIQIMLPHETEQTEGFDLLLYGYDFDRLWQRDLEFIQIDENTYRLPCIHSPLIRYQNGKPQSIPNVILTVIKEGEEYKIDRIDIKYFEV